MKHSATYFLALILLFSTPIVPNVADLGEAESRIATAEEGIGEAYLLMVEAERAGGDVSELVSRLNSAINLLQEAESSLHAGDYDEATSYAKDVALESKEILDDAGRLRHRASLRAEDDFRNRVILSLTLTSFIVLLGYTTWFYFKRYYMRKISGAKPGVIDVES